MHGEEGGGNIRLRIHLLHSISVVFMILVLAHKSEKRLINNARFIIPDVYSILFVLP